MSRNQQNNNYLPSDQCVAQHKLFFRIVLKVLHQKKKLAIAMKNILPCILKSSASINIYVLSFQAWKALLTFIKSKCHILISSKIQHLKKFLYFTLKSTMFLHHLIIALEKRICSVANGALVQEMKHFYRLFYCVKRNSLVSLWNFEAPVSNYEPQFQCRWTAPL